MRRGHSFSEENVLSYLSQGDEEAFRWVYDRYGQSVFRAAYRYLDSKDLAKDVVQEIFSALWHKRESFTEIRNLESYLVTMAHNYTYKELRKWAAESAHNGAYAADLLTATDDCDYLVRSNDFDSLISETIDRLPPQQKQIFQLSRIEGLSHEAIARQLNLSPGTVKNHIVRALQVLRKHLAPHVSLYLVFFFG